MNRILVVDDDEDILDCVSLILERHQIDVIGLSDCRKVVATMLDKKPDLVLLDVNLRFCDGRQLCLQLKNRHLYANHVVLFSANPELVQSIGLYQADDFIQKPFSITEFVKTIREHMPAS